jgi:diadenosine tetraphosphate (Ap4A) HIT family hydrolase
MTMPCPFCTLNETRVVLRNERALALRDTCPVSPGHTLIIPKRHVDPFFLLASAEQTAMLELLRLAKKELDRELTPAGYNIGLNDGESAGQTVMHVHLHLIPRYKGDRADPRGGVRWVLPETAAYWNRSGR